MATLEEVRNTVEDVKQAEHNALISERYRRLQNAELEQFGESNTYENRATNNVRASVLAPERPAYAPQRESVETVEQQPQITEYVRERIETPVFTTEKFNAVEIPVQMQSAQVIQPTVTPVAIEMPVVHTAVAREEQYSLTPLAKGVIAAFAAVAVMMFSLVSANTNVIRLKKIQLKNLEQKRQELVETNKEIQSRIESAKSEETIRQWAEQNGFTAPNS